MSDKQKAGAILVSRKVVQILKAAQQRDPLKVAGPTGISTLFPGIKSVKVK